MKLSIFSVQDHHPSRSRTVAQLYREVIDQALLADNLGYDTFFVAEHHFHEYGAIPNPAVFLATLAQRTTHLRLGTAISVLTFHDPLTIAESYAMVDLLSDGRLTLGVGSGYLKHEFEGYRVPPETKRDRFDESLQVLNRLLRGERVTFHGSYVNIENVQINVPTRQSQIPIYVAILRKEAAYHVGKQGHRLLFVPYASVDSFDEIAEMMSEFRRGREESGFADHRDAAAIALHAHVADTEEEVRRNAADAFDLYVATRLYAKRATYDDVMRSSLSLFGTVDQIAEKLFRLHEWGLDHVLTLQNFGLMAEANVHRSMQKMIKDVMPIVRSRLQNQKAA